MHANRLWTITAAARECGCDGKRLYEAARGHEVTTYPTANGLRLVTLTDVRKWMKSLDTR